MSSSRTSTPTPIAYSNAGKVFSGRMARAPRCPCTRIFGAAGSIAVHASSRNASRIGDPLILRPAQLALAAIAASKAFLAAMIRTCVLGAVNADLGGGLAADATGEG